MSDRSIPSRLHSSQHRFVAWLPASLRSRGPAPRGNALVLVAAVLLMLAIMGMAYIVRTQGAREIASATQGRALLDNRIETIVSTVTDEVNTSLFVKPIVAPSATSGAAGDPGLDPANNGAGVRPMARSDWPRERPAPTSSRYGIDPLDSLSNLLDPGNLNAIYGLGSDGYPDGYNFASYSVRPFTNWPDNFGTIYGESNPLGNPGYGDLRWLASTEPQRVTFVGNTPVPDPLGNTFSHWAHISWLPTAENGYRLVPDISNIVNNALAGGQGTPLTVPADPTTIAANTGIGSLGTPYEQWLPGVPPTPLASTSDFVSRRNTWFTPGGYYEAVTNPFGSGNTFPASARMLPNLLRLADPFNSGNPLTPGTRPTDAGPTRFLANGQPDDGNNTIRNILERTYADTDGDGITDSFWYLAPTSIDRNVRQLVAVRIIDNSAMLNLNVATRSQRRNDVPATAQAPAMRETRGHTPSDVALVSDLDQLDTPTGFLNSPDNALPTGFFGSSPQMTVAFDVANRWAGNAENNPTFLRERGFQRSSAYPNGAAGGWDLFAEQLRLQSERTRAFKSNLDDGQVRYFNRPAGSSLPQAQIDPTVAGYTPGGRFASLAPFTSADEAELRMSHGQNQPFILSRLERALNADANTNAFLRSAQTREESNEWSGKQLTIPELLVDARRKLTTISAARNELMPPALWTRWWNVDTSVSPAKLRAVDPDNPQRWFGPPGLDDLTYAYPTLAQLESDLVTGNPPAYPGIAGDEVFTTGGWRPEVIRLVAGDANNDGMFDVRDLDAARRDFFLWNSKQDLRAPIDLNRVGGQQPVVDQTYGVFGQVAGGVLTRNPGNSGADSFDHAFATIEWIRDFRRRLLAGLKSEYRGPLDVTTGLPVRTVSSYADRFQLGSDMPIGGFRTLTGTNRARSIVADGEAGKQVDTALKSEKVTNAMAASMAANAAVARRSAQFIGPFNTIGGIVVASWFTAQPLLPAHPSANAAEGNVPDQRVPSEDPDPTLPGSTPPGGAQVRFAGIEAHPVVMEAFFAVVWPKTRLGSTWQFVVGTNNPSSIVPKPASPYSVPSNYNDGGNESHFVAIVPSDRFVDQMYDWSTAAPEAWQRQSTSVIAVQVANPFPYPIRLGDFRLEVFGQTYSFPPYETDVNGDIIRYDYDTDGDGTNDPIPLMLGPTTEAEPRTAIVFAIADHNQINYRPGDNETTNQRRYPLTKGVEFDPFFRARWLDYLDIVEANDLGGANPSLQSAGLSGATPSVFCPHVEGVDGMEDSQATLTGKFPRRRLLGSSRPSSVLFGCTLNADNPIAQSKILDATQVIGTDVAALRPELGISVRRLLRNPETGVEIGTMVVDRFDRDASDTDQSSADPVSGWNLSMAAELLLDEDGRFWPPEIDVGHSANEDQMWPLLNAPPPPPPAPQPPPPWHLKPQQGGTFNGIRINTNDYFVTWTRASRLWGKDFAVVYGANADPLAYDRDPSINNGKGDGLITPDERAPRYAIASSKQRPDLPLDGTASSGVNFADGQGPFRGRNNSETYRGAAFQASAGLAPWVQDFTFNYGPTAAPYPLPPILKNPANSNTGDQGAGDPDLVGALVAQVPLKGNHLLPLVRNFTVSMLAENTGSTKWPPNNFTSDLNAAIMRVAMKPTNFTTRTVVGVPNGEVNPRQIFGLAFSNGSPSGVASPTVFLADKGLRPPATDSSMETEVGGAAAIAAAVDRLHPMDGAFMLGHKQADFDTVAEAVGVMIWGPVSEQNGNTRHTLGEILTDRVPGYPVGLVHRYVDLDGDNISLPEEQNPAWAHLNRIHVDNPGIAFSWFDINGMQANPPSQRFLTQWGGASGAVGAYASSLPLGTRLLEAFTIDDRGTTFVNGNYGELPRGADLDGNGTTTTNEFAQWIEDRRFRLAGGYSGKATPGLINVNTAPVEVLRALPHMSRLVYNDSTDLDGDGANDLADIDTNNDGLLDAGRVPPEPAANPFVRVAEAIDLYRSRTPAAAQNWSPSLVYPSRPLPGNTGSMPHYFDRGQIPGDTNGDSYQDNGFFPGMRADRGFDSLGETMLLTRNTAAPNGGGLTNNWAWNDNQSWSIRFAGLDPFRTQQAPAANTSNIGGGYRQLTSNGNFPAPPYSARISTDSFRGERLEFEANGSAITERRVPAFAPLAGDAREQDLLLSSLSNILTTRSDVFTVYLRVKSVKPDPITGRYDGMDPQLIVDDSRYVMCIDRSQVERPGDPPRIVYFQKVPH